MRRMCHSKGRVLLQVSRKKGLLVGKSDYLGYRPSSKRSGYGTELWRFGTRANNAQRKRNRRDSWLQQQKREKRRCRMLCLFIIALAIAVGVALAVVLVVVLKV